ncbi:hypothetical protein SPFL3102_03587 [Sporomusaceae bacterium FL31]|nr:hypothetical protein SPFL3101_00418 [Sporomusaceae bacterium FL31]GCE35736.1 hypothetical protein SPFL3102_03587 [Sporomusaceae bacterium]
MENQDIKSELIKMTPPVGVSTASTLGLTLADWVLLATLVYTVIQTGWLVYKIVRHFKAGGK